MQNFRAFRLNAGDLGLCLDDLIDPSWDDLAPKSIHSRLKLLPQSVAPPNEIAAELGCGEMTIHRRFGTVVKKGHEKCKTRIRSKLYKEAMAGNTAALIFLGKAVCGLRENDPATNITVTANASANPAPLSHQEMRRRLIDAQEYTAKFLAEYGNGERPFDGKH